MTTPIQKRVRARDMGIKIGSLEPGLYNAITDVEGVQVGQVTLNYDLPSVTRTGITVILPRNGDIEHDFVFAGFQRFNGFGEITGIQWVEDSGYLSSPIMLTTTNQIGMVRDAIPEYAYRRYGHGAFYLPVVAETYDGWLNDISACPLKKEHVFQALDNAASGPVAEGNVGGGTGMTCHDFKGGIGTSSRIVATSERSYALGALVQTNYGERKQLRVDGIPVGLEIGADIVPYPWEEPPPSSSIIIILATDAPLLTPQCKRLALRAASGLGRMGGFGHNSSGDFFLAFATGNHLANQSKGVIPLQGMLADDEMDVFFDAAVEAVEEAILNALTAAETMTGYRGHVAHALPLDLLQQVMEKYRPKA